VIKIARKRKKQNTMMKVLDNVAMTLTFVGGVNWGLAVFNVNLVDKLLGTMPMLENVVYGLVGLSALYLGFKAVKKKF
jgi:uncharacterized protein